MQRYSFLPKLLVISLFVIAISSPVYAQHPDAVGIWLCDEGAGNEVLDSSGNGHTGIAVNGDLEWGEGKFGGAVKFSPGSGHIEVADTDALDLETFTVECWAKFISDTGGGEQNVVFKQEGGDRSTRNYTVKTWAGSISANFASGGDGNYCKMSSQTNIGDGEWHHIALTYDKTSAKLYIDGEVEFEQELTGVPATNDAAIRIGEGVDALVDEIQILSVALSADEIQADMDNGISVVSSAVRPEDSLSTTWGQIKSGH